MSYLATLARPAVTPTGPAAEPAAARPVETFGEVSEEVVVAPPEVASQATEPQGTRSGDRPRSAMHDIEVLVERPAAAAEPSPRSSTTQEPLSTAVERVAPSTPVVAQRREAPAVAEASKPTRDMTSTRVAPSPVARRVMKSPAAVPARTEPVALQLSTEREPVPGQPDRGVAREEATFESVPVPRSPMTPSVRSEERAERPAARSTPAPTPRPEVNVHIGAISLTVKAPAAVVPAAPPAALPIPQPLPAAMPPRSREGLGFSASRHYLRWS